MISVALLCNSAPAPIAESLISAGYQVYEALDVSEVLHLCEHHRIDAVVIAPDVEDPDIIEAQLRHITLKLKAHATAKDVIWELETLFGSHTQTLQ